MTTATSTVFSQTVTRPAAPTTLLSIVSLLLGVGLRDSLAAQSQDQGVVTFGL